MVTLEPDGIEPMRSSARPKVGDPRDGGFGLDGVASAGRLQLGLELFVLGAG